MQWAGKTRSKPSKTCSKHTAALASHAILSIKYAATLAKHEIALLKHTAAPEKHAMTVVKHAVTWQNMQRCLQ